MWYKFTFPLAEGTESKHEQLLAAFNEIYVAAAKPCDSGLFVYLRDRATTRILYLYSGLDASLDSSFDVLVTRFGGEFSEQPPIAADVRQVGGDPSKFGAE